MLAIRIRTTQQSTNNLFYFLHILFILHIYTAFLTIVNSLNSNDNEAIIQLSVDSIHVVKSSDPRLSNIEETSNDDEEKELLIALLTSFDDEYKHARQIPVESPPEPTNTNAVSSINNCTTSSPSTISAAASSSAAMTSIRFIPSILDFGEQAIAMPRMQTVVIVNADSQPLELQSLSGTTVQFYSSFFTQKTLSPNGGNTSISVYYLPRTLGTTKSTFTIKTNRGVLHYYVSGIGTLSPFHLRPLIGANVPLNSTFEYVIHFYNPYNYSIDINEIYTSDENLFVELLSYKQPKNKIVKSFEHREQWHLKPHQVKPIVKINYFAYKLERLHGFYCIKTTSNDTIVVPVEINVANHWNLYSNVDMLSFSPENFLRSTARPVTIPVYVINNGRSPVTITDVRVTAATATYVTVHYEKVHVPAGIHHLTKVAELTIEPHLIPADTQRVRGSVQVYASSAALVSSTGDIELALQIPFRATVLHGSLDYDKTASYFYIPPSSMQSSNEKQQECRPMKLLNRFNTSMVIYNVTTDKPDLLSQYVQLNTTAPYVYARPGQSIFPVCVNILKRTASSIPFSNLEASLTLHTNLSYFHLPIYLYNGLLTLHVVADNSNGGIRRNDKNPSEYFVASVPVNSSRTVKFILANGNPVDIAISKVSLTIPKAAIQVTQMQAMNGSEGNVPFKSSTRNGNVLEILIPAHYQATFSLTINGTNDPSLYSESISFKTRFETLTMNLKYRIISGSIVLANTAPLHIDVFPSRLSTTDIILQNGFDEPTDVTRIEFPTYGNCFSFIWNTTSPNKIIIEANQAHQIGKLGFDMLPLCNGIQKPSESTCYCGLNNHPDFKKRWDQHVTALNTYELDEILVTKFRNLWKEWTSLVRKQRIQTNIWLITDQAELAWPVTIGFVWPSVLEFMTSAVSRTPVTIDYHLTLLNTTKAHNIVITNPSSTTLQFSVELISSYENKKSRNKRNPGISQSPFDLSTISKRAELAGDIYRFQLQPNEQIVFVASYRPKQSAKHEVYLVARNNLTIIESILLRGEGGSGSLTVGNRKAGSSDIPLVLEMNEKQYKLCSNYLSAASPHGNPVLMKVVTLRNTGNIRVVIHDVLFGQSKCSGQGFSIGACQEIEIEPGERYDLRIRFQPDYTLTEIAETLTLNTNIGAMTFPLLVRIPQRVLATCYQTIPRPPWETQIYWLCLCSIVIIVTYIVSSAIYEARRLYNDYLARVELRSRGPTMTERIFDINDGLAAVQDDLKNRERIESRTSPNTRKDVTKDEHKAKEGDTKAKKPVFIVNGNKENSEVTNKPRSSDGTSTSTRSTAASPRALSQKQKRAVTAENGSSKPAKQQPAETPVKPQTLKLAKPSIVEQPASITPPSSTPTSTAPSSTLTDEESEPFVVARPKRFSAKVKEPTTTSAPIKSTPITNGVVSSQSTPSPPPLPPSTASVSKPVARSDLSEARQHQQDVSRSSDSINDQQWYMVGSNRTLRKAAAATTNRREPSDEPQPAAKASRTAANNADFGRYIPQTEQPTVESTGTQDWIQSAMAPVVPLTESPLLLPVQAAAPPAPQLKPISEPTSASLQSSILCDGIEPLWLPTHGPGPIQRPNKLSCAPPQHPTLPLGSSSLHSPETPDVLEQINRLLDHQNSVPTTAATTPAATVSSTSIVNNASVPINDLTTSALPWNTFSPTEWPMKYDSSWPLTTIQNSTVTSTTQVQNPFAFMSTIAEPSRPTPREDLSVWSSVLGTATPRAPSSVTHLQRTSGWNDMFPSTVTPLTEQAKTNSGNSWTKFWPTTDPSMADATVPTRHETVPINPFWSLGTLPNEPVASARVQAQPAPSVGWWPQPTSDENNNKSQGNHLNDDPTLNRDQSRWDFAR